MNISRTGRVLVVVGAIGLASILSEVAGRRWWAAHLEDSRHPADWVRAAKLEPDNPAYQDRIGLHLISTGEPKEAQDYLLRAVKTDPRSDLYWMDLAAAYEASGQLAEAKDAFEKALEAHPASGEVRWRYGSFLLRHGDPQRAVPQIHQALIDRPELVESAVAEFWRAGMSPDQILETIVPRRLSDYLTALNYFVSTHEDDAALASWERAVGLKEPFSLRRSLALIDDLIAQRRIGEAARVWEQAVAASGQSAESGGEGSLIFDGGFESDPTNGGFDWRESPEPGTFLALVSDVAHSGSRSARVTFDGSTNVDYSGLQQYVAVTPGYRYRFTAYMRTDSISTDSGPQFQITDPAHPGRTLAATPVMTGTRQWTQVQAEFTAPPDTHEVTVILRRLPSSMFDNKIRGTVWVDDVTLKETGPAPIR